jgi:hypothetical protein
MTADVVDTWLERIAEGESLTEDALRDLAAGPDILLVGMLADAVRRRIHGMRTTYLRVGAFAADSVAADTVASQACPSAREIRIAEVAQTLDDAVRTTESAVAAARGRAVSGFSWTDVERWSMAPHSEPDAVLARLKRAGLDGLAVVAVDEIPDLSRTMGLLTDAGFVDIRLHVSGPAPDGRVDVWRRVADLGRQYRTLRAVNPLPSSSKVGRQSTGYDDVKMVAVARLAADSVPSIQLDWTRYGPKLAQVALTVGADDLDNVSASDDAPEGRRRAPLEEVRRNIESAGFEPTERDSQFRAIGA